MTAATKRVVERCGRLCEAAMMEEAEAVSCRYAGSLEDAAFWAERAEAWSARAFRVVEVGA